MKKISIAILFVVLMLLTSCGGAPPTDYTADNIDHMHERDWIVPEDNQEFYRFLDIFFRKFDKGEYISGKDLLSVKFIAYYGGEISGEAYMCPLSAGRVLSNNFILYSTESVNENVELDKILSYTGMRATYDYREKCNSMKVVSNEWMAKYIMPNLYYFRNLEDIVFMDCDVPEDMILPKNVRVHTYNVNSAD